MSIYLILSKDEDFQGQFLLHFISKNLDKN